MKQNDIIAPTLCPQEAVRLGGLRNVEDIKIVEKIYEAYYAENYENIARSPNWYTFYLLAVCWNAGRLEGVRMERARRKKIEDS